MSGQYRKDPFHLNRDTVRDNLTVVRKLRLPRGAQIRARKQYATATIVANAATVNMPYTGNINITLVGGTVGDAITINNPFITGNASQPIVLSGSSDPTAGVTFAAPTPGQVVMTLTGTAGNGDVLTVSVGRQTDATNNNFAQ